MTDVACFCGCCFWFDGEAAACPRCGEVARVAAGPVAGSAGRSRPEATAATAMAPATDVYALGRDPGESARLQRQSEELGPDSAALLDRVGLGPGQDAIDLGCGPRGILDLLAERVAPGGHVAGLDADPAHVAMARQFTAQRGLGNVEIVAADARCTGLPPGSFDLVHARTLLVNVPEPADVLAEMVRLARPGGWVASLEPDVESALCYSTRWTTRSAFTSMTPTPWSCPTCPSSPGAASRKPQAVRDRPRGSSGVPQAGPGPSIARMRPPQIPGVSWECLLSWPRSACRWRRGRTACSCRGAGRPYRWAAGAYRLSRSPRSGSAECAAGRC